jgi:hypothetical protein
MGNRFYARSREFLGLRCDIERKASGACALRCPRLYIVTAPAPSGTVSFGMFVLSERGRLHRVDRKADMFESHRARQLRTLDNARGAYHEAAVFGVSSLNFHRRALDAATHVVAVATRNVLNR